MKVQDLLESSARNWPDKPAVIDTSGVMDYKTLFHNVEAMRRCLENLGLKPGHGVGVMGQNSCSFIASVFAALASGAIVMPLPHTLKRGEMLELLKEAHIHAILDDQGGIHPTERDSHVLDLPLVPKMRFSRTGHDTTKPFVDFIPDAAFVRFTSGTTGKSKGVVITHQGVLERTAAANKGLNLSRDTVVIWILPMAFHFFVSIVLYLRVGAAIVLCPDHFPDTILQLANTWSGTFLYAAPIHYQLLAFDSSPAMFQTLQCAISTAISLPVNTAQAFYKRYGLAITQAYGIIEIGLPLINLREPHIRPESVGRPLPDYEIAIFDDNLQQLPRNTVGQLAVRGPGLFAAYMSPPRLARDILHNGWFLTGDLALQDDEGYVTILGRCKSLINVAGNKVFPEEVEKVLMIHPLVDKARVSGKPHPLLGEIVHADVVLKPGSSSLDVEGFISFFRDKLSSYKIPQSVDFVKEIEETESGKISRKKE